MTDIHPIIGLDAHVHYNNSRIIGDAHNFIPKSAVAMECLRRGRSIHDRHAVYEEMKREGHPAVVTTMPK